MATDGKIFELLVDTVKDYAVFVLDPGGHVMTWNSGARQLKGYEPGEIIGRHFSTFYTEEAKQRLWPDYELKMATLEGRFEDEGWRLRKDGSRFWANVVITALRNETGQLLGFSKITRDLTTRRAAEETLRQSEERFRLLIEGVVDYAVYMLNPDGVITSWNTGAQRIKGYTRDEVLGKHFSHFYLPEDIEAGKPWAELASARLQGHVEDEGWRVRKDGTKFWARVVVTALHDTDGHLRGFAKVTQDLSARRHAQELERTTQHVSEFIAVLAHELRNPLAPIRNALAVMGRMTDDPITQDAMRQTIARQTTHLARIVDDLLDVSRATRGTLAIEHRDVDVTDIVARAVEIVAPEAARVHQTLSVEVPPEALRVKGDRDRLTQLLSNLLMNAVRFTPERGQINVRAKLDGGQVALSVRDTGRGIAAEDLQGIFGMFVQGKEAIHRVGGGLGIGLALARRIAELHEGTIEARSRGVGQGSEFTVRLPASSALPRTRIESSPPPPEPTSITLKRVLVVDDNIDAANTLEMLLRSLGHETRVVYDGPSALEAADEFNPDVVLLDIGMPGMNGFEVARHLRARKNHHVKIVAVTGWGSDADRARAVEAGFDRHLVKPIDETDLRQVLINGVTQH